MELDLCGGFVDFLNLLGHRLELLQFVVDVTLLKLRSHEVLDLLLGLDLPEQFEVPFSELLLTLGSRLQHIDLNVDLFHLLEGFQLCSQLLFLLLFFGDFFAGFYEVHSHVLEHFLALVDAIINFV